MFLHPRRARCQAVTSHISGNRGGNLSWMFVFVSMTKSPVNKPKPAQQRRLCCFWCSVFEQTILTIFHISETLVSCWRFQLLLNQNLKFWFHRPFKEIINDPNSKLCCTITLWTQDTTWGQIPLWTFQFFDDSAGETVWMPEISKPAQTAVMKFLTYETETFTFAASCVTFLTEAHTAAPHVTWALNPDCLTCSESIGRTLALQIRFVCFFTNKLVCLQPLKKSFGFALHESKCGVSDWKRWQNNSKFKKVSQTAKFVLVTLSNIVTQNNSEFNMVPTDTSI